MKKEAGGKLEGALDSKLTGGFIGGSVKGSLDFNDNEKKVSEGFKCTYIGNVPVTNLPNDYQSAIQAVQEILTKVETKDYTPIPQKIWLQPLSHFSDEYKNVKADIEQSLLSKCLQLNEQVTKLLQDANDLADDSTVRHYPHFWKKAQNFLTKVGDLDLDIKWNIGELIVEVRKGNDDSGLREFLDNIQKRSFNIADLNQWLSKKNIDKSHLSKFFVDLEDVRVVSDAGEHITRKGRNDVCLIIKMREMDPYLDSNGEKYIEQAEYFATEGEVWRKVDQFRRFIENNAGKGFTFHVKALTGDDAVLDCYFEIWRADKGEIKNIQDLPPYLEDVPVVKLPAVTNLRTFVDGDSDSVWVFWDIPKDDLRNINIDSFRGVKHIDININKILSVGPETVYMRHEIEKENIKFNDVGLKRNAQIFGLDKDMEYEVNVKMVTDFGLSPKASIILR